ncbi:hypothetical protein Ae201684_017132 [Aphanomyces euteiches]|uniref:Glycine zipper domain-containing protein n=1 Tax=Aphanomyces euteiches TaxID=100861 RepID=A0A6G0W9V5_9STRA|nr:hypothetical protein Ae201684_017132 [Aphanomyces euteiches]
MRFWMLLAVASAAVMARSPERSHDLRFVMPVASIDFAESRFLESRQSRRLTAPGKANQANNPRGRYERSGFKNGGRVGAAVGATAGVVAGTIGGGAAGTAIAGPAGGVVGAAFGVTSGIYAGMPLGRQAGAKIGAAGGRVIDKVKGHMDAKAKANAPVVAGLSTKSRGTWMPRLKPMPHDLSLGRRNLAEVKRSLRLGRNPRSRRRGQRPLKRPPARARSALASSQERKNRLKQRFETRLRRRQTKCSVRKHLDHLRRGDLAEVRLSSQRERDRTSISAQLTS